MKSIKDPARELLEKCQAARANGLDFPTIWETIIRRDPLVIGLPTQVATRDGSALEIQLLSARKLVSSVDGFSLKP